jgi:hypothetical protein
MSLSAEFAIGSELNEAICLATCLETLRAGRHVLRDAQRRKTGELIIRKLWAVRVQPSAAASACLACLVTELRTSIAFAVPSHMNESNLITRVLHFDEEWLDPVATTLTSLDLWSGSNRIPLSGCSYNFFVDTTRAKAIVGFSNPQDLERRAVQGALLDVAKLFVTDRSEDVIMDFVNHWEKLSGADMIT